MIEEEIDGVDGNPRTPRDHAGSAFSRGADEALRGAEEAELAARREHQGRREDLDTELVPRWQKRMSA